MPTFNSLVKIGGVVFITEGVHKGKTAAIVEIIDGNRALIEGPSSEIPRQSMNFRIMNLTKLAINIRHGARSGTVRKAWEAAEVDKKWSETSLCRKLKQQAVRKNLTDFDRFKLMKAKQARNRIVRAEFNKLKKQANKK